MAKKAEETGTQKARMTGERKLKELLGIARSVKNDVSELAGKLGSAIANAVEKNHLHRKAFRAAVAEDRMEPEKLADYYDNLDYYRDVLGLTERAKSAPKFSVIEGGKDDGEAQAEAAE